MARVVKTSRSRYWQVRWIDHTGSERQQSSKTTDKRTAEQLARKLEDASAKVKTGLVTKREAKIMKSSNRLAQDHLDAYLQWCRDQKRQDKDWIKAKRSCVESFLDKGAITLLTDVDSENLNRHLTTLDDAGKSARTINAARAAVV